MSDDKELAVQAAVFIDSDVPDLAALLAGLAPGEEAFVLDPASDGVKQIADIIAAQHLTNLSSISIVGHGAAGAIHLGSTTLDDGDLSTEAPALAAIGSALAPGGDLALYACDVGAGATGQQFIANLSAYASGVEVAAATHVVGGASGGGSWTLDATAGGSSAVAAPFTDRTLASYQGELAAPKFTFNGVNYVADIYGSFANANSLPQAVAANVNAIAVVADFGIDAEHNTVYDNDVPGGFTETDDHIATTISNAVGLGLGVMVRPIIDFLPADYNGDTNPLNAGYSNSEWRTYYNPGAAGSTGANSFFASYQSMLVGQAELAQANGASIFSIGVELDQLAGSTYLPYWTSIINAVHAVFTGKLTYGADWDDSDSPWQYGGSGLPVGTGNITTQISFWNQLDYVGIDEYAPISDLANPTVSQLIAGWTQKPTDTTTLSVTGNQSLISYYQGVAAAIGKPLLFTELGYANSSDAASSPATPGYDENGNADNATADPTLQANLYSAFYQAWSQDGNGSVVGAYLWNWEPGGAGVSPFSVQGLPAQAVVTAGNAPCYGRGTRILTERGEIAVENLRVGDLAVTASGVLRPIVWIGHRRVDISRHPDPASVWPVRVSADAFGEGLPQRDLWLSPGHSVACDAALIPISCLLNGRSVVQIEQERVEYWHVELDAHDILLAEGMPAESYLDCGNRTGFANGGAFVEAHPDFRPKHWAETCLPMFNAGPQVAAAKARCSRGWPSKVVSSSARQTRMSS